MLPHHDECPEDQCGSFMDWGNHGGIPCFQGRSGLPHRVWQSGVYPDTVMTSVIILAGAALMYVGSPTWKNGIETEDVGTVSTDEALEVSLSAR